MSRSAVVLAGVMSAMVLLGAIRPRPARAEGPTVLPRPGQGGVGIQGGYGSLLKNGEVGSLFDSGPPIGIRLRYRMRYERAIGLSFEGQRFDIRVFEPHFPANDT